MADRDLAVMQARIDALVVERDRYRQTLVTVFETRERIIKRFAHAMYACTFQQSIEESDDVAEAWRIWRDEALRVLDDALGPPRKEAS